MATIIENKDANVNDQPSIWGISIKGGLVTGAVVFLITLIFQYILGMFDNIWLMTAMGVLAVIIGIVLTHRGFKSEGDGYMTYGQGLGIAVISMTIAGLLGGLLSFLYITLVDPTIPEQQADAAAEMTYSMTERFGGEVTDELEAQIEEQRQSTIENGGSFLYLVLASAGAYLVMGLIFGLIISAFTKNNHPEQVY